jgi:kynurenine formamidase
MCLPLCLEKMRSMNVKGIVVDTLSLDRGLSADFPVHVRWLGSNRWGLECAANLGELPRIAQSTCWQLLICWELFPERILLQAAARSTT